MTADPWVPASVLGGLLMFMHVAPVPLWLGFRWLRWAST